MRSIPLPIVQSADIDGLDRFTKLNVLALLGQTIYEAERGNDARAFLYLGTALVAFKSKNLSFALQGVFAADRTIGRVTGIRPLRGALPFPTDSNPP